MTQSTSDQAKPATWKDYIEISDLSERERAIARAIGIPKFIALTTMLSKIYLYLKKVPEEKLYGPLTELPEDYQFCIAAIGRESTQQLAKVISKTLITFRSPERVFLPAKIRYFDAHFDGRNIRRLAMQIKVSVDHLYKHINKNKRAKTRAAS